MNWILNEKIDLFDFTSFFPIRLLFFMYLQHQQPNPAEEWLEEKAWSEIVWASRLLRSFQGFMEHFKDHLEEWKNFYDSANPMEVELPKGYEKLE